MKHIVAILFGISVLILSHESNAQTTGRSSVMFGDGMNKIITADEVIIHGETFEFKGNITERPIGQNNNNSPDEPPGLFKRCGGNTGWICGRATITNIGDGHTIVECIGTRGRCAKVQPIDFSTL